MIVISGYHGYRNLGDEAILAALCDDLVSAGTSRDDIVVLSADERYTQATHGVRAIGRWNPSEIWRILGKAHYLVSGGGSLLQDATSSRTIPYYLGIAEMAFARKVPVVFYGHGIGPVGSPAYGKWIRRAFNKSVGFTIRDSYSGLFLDELGVTVPSGAVAVDPVFKFPTLNRPNKSVRSNHARIAINIRPYPQWTQQKLNWVALVVQLIREGHQVKFMPLGPGDAGVGSELANAVPELELLPLLSFEDFQNELQQIDVCISMRLHGVIVSAISNVVPLAVNYDQKVHAICEQLGSRCVELTESDIIPILLQDVLTNYSTTLMEQNRRLGLLQELANRNTSMLHRILGQPVMEVTR